MISETDILLRLVIAAALGTLVGWSASATTSRPGCAPT